MAEIRRALLSTDVHVDETTERAMFDINLATLAAAVAGGALTVQSRTPAVCLPQTDHSLDDGNWHEEDLPDNALFVIFSVDQAAYICLGAATTNPTKDGVPFYPNIDYRLDCDQFASLYGKRVSATATLKWTVWASA